MHPPEAIVLQRLFCNDRGVHDGASSGSSVCSDSGSSIVSEAKDLVRRAHDQAATAAFEGNTEVENSTQVLFGNNTHYHGLVTVLRNSTKCVANSRAASAPPLAAVAQDAALPEQPPEQSPEQPPEQSPEQPPEQSPEQPPDQSPEQPPDQSPEQTLEQPTYRTIAAHADAAPKRKEAAVRWRCVTLWVAAATTLVVAVVLLRVVLPGPNKIAPETLSNGLTLVQRHEWLAQPAKPGVDRLTASPVDHVILHHSATDPCFNFTVCSLMVRYFQMYHMESKNWSDIGYNFLVGGDGYVYVGRGWDLAGAHTKFWNHRSMGICLVGTFSYEPPTDEQLGAVRKLIAYGVQLNKVVADYKLAAVCQFRSSESPGKVMLEEMKKWPHYWNYTVGDSRCT